MTSTQAPDANYLRAIWTLLIAFGGALAEERHTPGRREPHIGRYDGVLDIDFDASRTVALKFVAGGSGIVDFANCTDPAEGVGFHGDTQDFDQQAHYLAGTLALITGERIPWGTLLPEGGFGQLVRLLATAEATDIDAAFRNLVGRISEAADGRDWAFRYTCEIGRYPYGEQG